jgi:hypothetical protein
MDLRSLLLKQLNTAERIVPDGHEVIPAWRIATPSADWVILSRFDHAEPNRQDWVLQMRRFMARTFAQSFIVSGQMGCSSAALVRSSEEAIVGLAATYLCGFSALSGSVKC